MNIDEMKNHDEWLNGLKAGDEVYVSGRYGALGSISKVLRTTKTQILISEYDRFRKINGREMGNSWGARYLSQPTDERRAQIYERRLRTNVPKEVAEIAKNGPLEILRRIELIVKEHTNEQASND